MPKELFLCFYCTFAYSKTFGKIRFVPGENTRFLPDGAQFRKKNFSKKNEKIEYIEK